MTIDHTLAGIAMSIGGFGSIAVMFVFGIICDWKQSFWLQSVVQLASAFLIAFAFYTMVKS